MTKFDRSLAKLVDYAFIVVAHALSMEQPSTILPLSLSRSVILTPDEQICTLFSRVKGLSVHL